PLPETWTIVRRGFASQTFASERPSRSYVPGREDSIQMSESRARSRKTALPSGRRASNPTESLLRAYWTHDSETWSIGELPERSGTSRRVGSAYGGANGGPSTWTTR